MVTATERLQQQRATQLASRRTTNLQLQQESRRTGKPQQQIIQEREVARAKAELEQKRKSIAQEIDAKLKNPGSISQVEQALKDVPPEIKRYLQNTAEKFKQKNKQTLSKIDSEIQRAKERLEQSKINEKEASRESDSRREDRAEEDIEYYKAYLSGLQQGKNRISRGEIISEVDIKNYADDLGDREKDRERAKNERNKAVRQEASKLGMTSTEYRKEIKRQKEIEKFKQTDAFKNIQKYQKQIEARVKRDKESRQPKSIKDIFGTTDPILGTTILPETSLPMSVKPSKKDNLFSDVWGKIKGFEGFEKEKVVGGEKLLDFFSQIKPKKDDKIVTEGLPVFKPDLKVSRGTEKVLSPQQFKEAFGIIGYVPTKVEELTEKTFFPKQETLSFEYESPYGIGAGGTGMLKEVVPSSKISAKEQLRIRRIEEELKAQTEFENKAKDELKFLVNKYTTKFKNEVEGVETQKEAELIAEKVNKQYQSEAERTIKILESKYKVGAESREKKRVDSFLEEDFKQNWFKTVVRSTVRTPFYFVPYYGQALLASDIGGGILEAPSVVSSFKERPLLTAKQVGVGIIGGIIGGGVTGFAKSRFKASQVKNAIKKANVKVESKGILTKFKIDLLQLDEFQKLQLKRFIDQGYSVRSYATKLKPSKGLESLTPAVKGRFIEVTSNTGKVIQRRAFGEVTATLGKKTVSQDILSASLKKVDDVTKAGYTEVAVITPRTPIIGIGQKQKGELFKFKETDELVSTVRTPDELKILSRSKAELLKQKKFDFFDQKSFDVYKTKYKPGTPLLKDFPKGTFPDTELMQGKPFSKTVFGEVQKPKGLFKGDILLTDDLGDIRFGFIGKDITLTSRGVGLSKFIDDITPDIKISKTKTPFSKTFAPDEVVKTTKVKYPKPKPWSQVLKEEGLGQISKPSVSSQSILGTQTALLSSTQQLSKGLGNLGKTFGGFVGGTSRFKDLPKEQQISFQADKSLINLQSDLIQGEILKTQPLETTSLIQPVKEDILLKQKITPIEKIKLDTTLKLRQDFSFDTPQFQPQITIPPIKTPFTFNFEFPKTKKTPLKKQKSPEFYDVYTKRRGKPIKINPNPISGRSRALDVGSYIVDNSLAGQFSIKKTKAKTKKKTKQPKFGVSQDQFSIPPNYWQFVGARKFRYFQKVKGRKRKLKNTFIERDELRLDTAGEVSGITANRLAQQVRSNASKIGKSQANLSKVFGL